MTLHNMGTFHTTLVYTSIVPTSISIAATYVEIVVYKVPPSLLYSVTVCSLFVDFVSHAVYR